MTTGLPDEAAVRAVLSDFKDPETGRSVTQMDQIPSIQMIDDRICVTLALTSHSAPLAEETALAVRELLEKSFPDVSNVEVELAIHQRPPEPMGEIGLTAKSVIAVGSGKGGGGKSTIAVAIALGLKRAGSSVGLMDADVYGPSVPHLLGLSGRPEVEDGKIRPMDYRQMPVMSMGFMVPVGEAVVWRGPMLHGAITQMLRDTRWGNLDYLIIDMPPGTGDIALTLSQLLPLTGAVTVCTPQDVALLDAEKAIAMFRKVNIPILGMVENMSGFVCPDCQKRHDIFGQGGARQRAESLDVSFLGEVPINLQIRLGGDQGDSEAALEDKLVGPAMSRLSYQLVKNLAESRAEDPPTPTLPVL